MITNDGKGNDHRLQAGQEARRSCATRTGTRRPTTGRRTSTRSTFQGGNDATVASRKILDGQSMLSGDYAAPPTPVLKPALQSQQGPVSIDAERRQPLHRAEHDRSSRSTTSTSARRSARRSTATRCARRAAARRSARSPRTSSRRASRGFEEAGGTKGPGFDFTTNPTATLALATEYMKKAGYPSGKYTGPALLMVADNQSPATKTARGVPEPGRRSSASSCSYRRCRTRRCTRSSARCRRRRSRSARTSAGARTSSTPQSFIDPLFNGKNIVPSGNVNYRRRSNDPKLNAQIDKAKQITDPTERAQGVGRHRQGGHRPGATSSPWLWDNNVEPPVDEREGRQSKFNSAPGTSRSRH